MGSNPASPTPHSEAEGPSAFGFVVPESVCAPLRGAAAFGRAGFGACEAGVKSRQPPYPAPMSTAAHLCATCGFGPKASQCIACGAPFAETPAQLCSTCGFGPAAQQCVKCRKPFANIAARLCRTCGFGPRAQACIKCGRMF